MSAGKLVIWPQALAPFSCAHDLQCPELALRAQLLAAHAPAPSHLRPLSVPKQRLAGRREGTEERARREELQQRESVVGGLLLGFTPSFQPRHMGWQMKVPLQGALRAAHRPRRARVRKEPLGWL